MLFNDLPRPATRLSNGVAHLPGLLPLERQKDLVTEARSIARLVAGTPFRMQRPVLASGQMSAYIMSLGWHWSTRPYGYVAQMDGHTVHPLPLSYHSLATEAVAAAATVDSTFAPWSEGRFRPEIALVNYYPPGSRMGMHVDANEDSDAPVLSFSIGDEALFRIGGTENRNKPWDEVVLMSGDLIVFGGPKRRAYHGVVEVRDQTLPAGCGLAQGRINITIRQKGL